MIVLNRSLSIIFIDIIFALKPQVSTKAWSKYKRKVTDWNADNY